MAVTNCFRRTARVHNPVTCTVVLRISAWRPAVLCRTRSASRGLCGEGHMEGVRALTAELCLFLTSCIHGHPWSSMVIHGAFEHAHGRLCASPSFVHPCNLCHAREPTDTERQKRQRQRDRETETTKKRMTDSGTEQYTLAFVGSQLCRDGTLRRQSMSQTDDLAMQAGSVYWRPVQDGRLAWSTAMRQRSWLRYAW